MANLGQKNLANGVLGIDGTGDNTGFANATALGLGNNASTLQTALNAKANLIASPTANHFVYTNGAGQSTDSGLSFSTDTTFASASNSLVSSSQAIKTFVQNSITGALLYQGNWNASTNTPTLTAGTGTINFAYFVTVAGTQTTPSGSPVNYEVGDTIYYGANNIWNQIPAGNTVTSVNALTGAVQISFENLTDSAIVSPISGQLAINNGTDWVNQTLSGDATLAANGALTVSNAAVINKILTGLVTTLNLIAPAATDSILQAIGKLTSTASTAYFVVHDNASHQFLINEIVVIMDADAQNGILPDATSVVPGVQYTYKLGVGASTGTMAVITGQSLDDVVNGTFLLSGVENSASAISDGTGWYVI